MLFFRLKYNFTLLSDNNTDACCKTGSMENQEKKDSREFCFCGKNPWEGDTWSNGNRGIWVCHILVQIQIYK